MFAKMKAAIAPGTRINRPARANRSLRHLDAHIMRDIGLTQFQIERAVNEWR